MKRKKVFGFDIDGILVDFLNPFREWLNKRLGKNIQADAITSYYWYECTDITKEDFWKEFHFFNKSGAISRMELLPDALETLSRIHDAGHEIHYITNRPSYIELDTRAFFHDHNFPQQANLSFAGGLKAPYIQKHAIDVFIEDAPHTLTELIVGTRASIYCFSYPYNLHLDDTFMTRVGSLREFLSLEGF